MYPVTDHADTEVLILHISHRSPDIVHISSSVKINMSLNKESYMATATTLQTMHIRFNVKTVLQVLPPKRL